MDGRGLADEFVAGFGGGVDSLQMSLFGVLGLAGRELGIKPLEDFGIRGAERNLKQAESSGRESGGFTDIESAGGFFKWAAATTGELLPSLALALGTGVGGGFVARKVIENQIKRTLHGRIKRTLTRKVGKEAADDAATRILVSRQGEQLLETAVLRGKTAKELGHAAFQRGAAVGASTAGGLPITGQIDLELQEAGIDAGFTAILGGVAGGALEAIPALMVINRVFPGVETQVAKRFVKDFAVNSGVQALAEGTTEGAQEVIQLAAMAYHDPSFDMNDPANAKRIIDAFAAGALIGGITGAGAELLAPRAKQPKAKQPSPRPETPEYEFDSKLEDYLPEDFEPADNTVLQEVHGRVNAAVGRVVNPIMNKLRNGTQAVINALDKDLAGGMNEETAKFSQLISSIHKKFVDEHSTDLDRLKAFVAAKSVIIADKVKGIVDPKAREEQMLAEIQTLQQEIEEFTAKLAQDQEQQQQDAEAEVDNMDFSDVPELLPAEDELVTETEATELPSDVVTQDDVLFEAPEKFVLGKFQREGTLASDGSVDVVGYDTQEQAENALEKTVKPEFPSAQEDTFEIRQQDDGTFVIGVREIGAGEALAEDKITSDAIKRSRKAAKDFDTPDRHFKPEGKSKMDIITLARRGRDLTRKQGPVTLRQGLQAMAARLLDRGVITSLDAEAMIIQFDEFEQTPAGQLDATSLRWSSICCSSYDSPPTTRRILRN
jgi:hypothetical protein